MVFNNLDHTYEKLQELNKVQELFYDPLEKYVFSGLGKFRDVVIEDRDRRLLHAVYKKAYYAYAKMSCEDCRVHRLIQLEIELGKFLEEMDRKYGG